ncbi:AraC family transcriptional regulator [Sulfurimonas microaerophilic]|uniref:AraC family transcriptional regulator n=1 Tax=Sulfurimonas microaerophilic TaxID=3058392 RepID=UPI0027146E69|nr:AraC family transcriptional regulator [Sulfurimonas sp. hsl 1-7]
MTTQESYIRSVYKVVFFIEKNYAENLTLEELSTVAGFSKYHFHRIFKSVMGENVGDYIRKIRLQSTIVKFKMDKNITQIAMESGYETNASFSKAFKKRFGFTPREFAKKLEIKKGAVMVTPKIVETEPINVLFVRARGEYMSSADTAWKKMVEYITKHNLFLDVAIRYGISHDNPNVIEAENLRYDACVEFKEKLPNIEGEIAHKQIAGGKYAVFTHKGAYAKLGETFAEIGTWIVTNGIALRDEPQVQKYMNLDPTTLQEEDLRTEIYVPII